jgi:hypothetical protein
MELTFFFFEEVWDKVREVLLAVFLLNLNFFHLTDIHAAELSGLLKTAPEYVMQIAAGRIINRFSQVDRFQFEVPCH